MENVPVEQTVEVEVVTPEAEVPATEPIVPSETVVEPEAA